MKSSYNVWRVGHKGVRKFFASQINAIFGHIQKSSK